MVQLRLLGPLELAGARGTVPVPRAKERVLLTMLALRANEVVSDDMLVDALWGDQPPRTAVKTLRSYVSRLRDLLAEAGAPQTALETAPGGYRLNLGPSQLDVAGAQALVSRARDAAARYDYAAAAELFAKALRSWRGPPLGDLADEPWASAHVAAFNELRLLVIEEQLDATLNSGHHGLVAAEAEKLVREHPLRERLWEVWILALYRAGRQAEALQAYQQLRKTLKHELGIDPTPALQALERAVLTHDPQLLPGVRPPVSAQQPAADAAIASGQDGPEPPSIRVIIADDHPLWRQTLRGLLEATRTAVVVAAAANGQEAIEATRDAKPDVVLMDIDMPRVDGIEATRQIVAERRETRVLVLSSLKESREVLAAVRAGASGYLVKTAEATEIAQAIRQVHRGELAFPPELAQLVLGELRSTKPAASPLERAGLTAQEGRVLELMASGQSNHSIAQSLRLAPKTVEAHVTCIFSKMGLEPTPDQHRRVQAVLAYLHEAPRG